MDAKIRLKETDDGLYVYAEFPGRDILLTDHVVKDKFKKQMLRDFVTSLEFRLFAYEQYKTAMNEAFILCRARGVGGDIEKILRDTLHQFGDLSMPGDLNRK